MNKVALGYKGIFNINHIRNKGVNFELLESFNSSIDNHIEKIHNLIKNNNYLDVFISTYDIDDKLNNLFFSKFNVVKQSFISNSHINNYSCTSQILHHKNIISMIKEEEINNNFKYDTIIITRPDIRFNKFYNEISINKDSFNITIEHESKNCDDNFWIFPRIYLDLFEKSLDSLLSEGKITHEINHKLKDNGVPIHYMEPLFDGPYEQHILFTFIR